MEENVALNGNWKATHVFYTNSRTRWHECALYIMQRPPFKRVCANTQEVANPENLNCNFVLYTFLAITLFALFFPSLFLCAVSNIFPIIFSLLSFFFLLLDFLFSFFLPSCFSLFLLFPGHVLTSRSVYLWYFCANSESCVFNRCIVECKVNKFCSFKSNNLLSSNSGNYFLY